MQHAMTGWIDIPVVEALEYFTGILFQFYNWGRHYAFIIGLIGLCWSAFRLANSRFTLRDFWWDTIYKWLLFILMMSIYPSVTFSLSQMANRIGSEAGSARQVIVSSLESMKQSIEHDLSAQQQWANDLESDLSRFEEFEFTTSFGTSDNYDAYINSLAEEAQVARFDSKAARRQALDLINQYREKNEYHSLYSRRTLAAIEDILIPVQIDGTKGESQVSSYIDLNIWLKDSGGSDTCYLSPGAILRVTILGVQILWEKSQLVYAVDLDNIDTTDANFIKKGFSRMTTTMAHIPTMCMAMLCCIILIFCGLFAVIQYFMTILEYIILAGIGAFFIPFILFDGTKELPRKLVPALMGFIIKIVVMTICMFFVFYLFIQNTVDIMADNGGMNWVTFITVIFNGVVGFILTQNAPKLAVTLLTGQPQLSMGEFVQAAGSMYFGAKIGGKAAKEGTRKTAQGTVNTAGGITRLDSARKAASGTIKASGGSWGQQFTAGAKGMYAAATTDLKDKVRNAGNNFLHGGTKPGAGGGIGGSASGTQAHQRSGQITTRDLGPEETRTLNATSNPKFQTATRFDEKTQSVVNMTHKEFLDEKAQQGAAIGNTVAQRMMEEAEKKQQAQVKDTKLPESITGGERASKQN